MGLSMTRIIATLALFILLGSLPASAEIDLNGSQLFGLRSLAGQDCHGAISMSQDCRQFKSSDRTHQSRQNSPLKISAEARMGLLYSDGTIHPKSKVSIHIHFQTETDNGLVIGGHTTIERH